MIELGTSMRRHGLIQEELAEAADLLSGVPVEGLTLHLPLLPPASAGEVAWLLEAEAWLGQARDAGLLGFHRRSMLKATLGRPS